MLITSENFSNMLVIIRYTDYSNVTRCNGNFCIYNPRNSQRLCSVEVHLVHNKAVLTAPTPSHRVHVRLAPHNITLTKTQTICNKLDEAL